jgi:glycosyltransferase involved in cell wall biosynthesis
MQRMTRRIFAELAERLPSTPICWNRYGNFYHRLGVRETEYLEAPFRRYRRPLERPQANEGLVGELGRLLKHSKIDLVDELQRANVFLVPDMFSDQRTRRLPEWLRRTPARSVAIFHDAAELRLGVLSAGRAQRFRNYMRALAEFDLVICISNESRVHLTEFWEQSAVHRQPETLVESWPVEFDETERFPVRSSRVVLYVSSFTARKNHTRLFEAARKLWEDGVEFELQLIGSSANRGRKTSLELRRLQARGWPVRWLRHVNDRTLHQAYRECLFTVYPSLMEGFGLPVVESLWHGKPCVCGGNGALGEVARGGGCFIVDQLDTEALADGIRKLLLDRELYDRLCEEARARKFRSWSNYIEKLVGHFRPTPRAVSVANL